MTAATGVASIALFVLALMRSGLVTVSGRAVATAREAGRTMRDPGRDDDAKERAIRAASLTMFRHFGSILVRGLVVLAVSAVPIVLADLAEVVSAGAVTDWLLRIDVIVVASLGVTLGWLIARRLWPTR